MPTPSTTTAIAIFAKYPIAGRVKTRLAGAIVPGYQQLQLDDCATLYDAFLRDYQHRFHREALGALDATAYFCTRPGPNTETFQQTYCQDAIGFFLEPTFRGAAASDIGQAIGYTFRGLLNEGFEKVIILGSDLPHIPLQVLADAIAQLDEAPFVLGNDGGGCYLMAASAPVPIVETGEITWSEGRDFDALCNAQRNAGQPLAILPKVLEDIDTPEALGRLQQALAQPDATLTSELPHTTEVLRQWGWVPTMPS